MIKKCTKNSSAILERNNFWGSARQMNLRKGKGKGGMINK